MYLFSQQRNSLAKAKGLGLFVLLLNYQPAFAQNNNDAEMDKNPALPYQSVFSGYQSFKEQPVSSWREINDEVEKIGGWRAYASEASNSEASASEDAQPVVTDKPDALPAKKGGSNLTGGRHE